MRAVTSQLPKYCTEMCRAVTNQWTYVFNASANPVDLVFRTKAGHVKQGLRCKHCRVNIHQSCGAKVLLDKVNFPWSLQSFKYIIKDIYWPICKWWTAQQPHGMLYPRWVYASQRRKRGCSGEASPSMPRKCLGQADHKMTSESCQEKYIELVAAYPITLFFFQWTGVVKELVTPPNEKHTGYVPRFMQ